MARSRGPRAELPGVGLRRGPTGAREDLVERSEHVGFEVHVERAECAVDLGHRAGPDDRRGHHRVLEQPRERDVGGWRAHLGAELLPLLELRAELLDAPVDEAATASSPGGAIREHTAEQPAGEWA